MHLNHRKKKRFWLWNKISIFWLYFPCYQLNYSCNVRIHLNISFLHFLISTPFISLPSFYFLFLCFYLTFVMHCFVVQWGESSLHASLPTPVDLCTVAFLVLHPQQVDIQKWFSLWKATTNCIIQSNCPSSGSSAKLQMSAGKWNRCNMMETCQVPQAVFWMVLIT